MHAWLLLLATDALVSSCAFIMRVVVCELLSVLWLCVP